jgi:Spy/CpxP family protein refolding chaperone
MCCKGYMNLKSVLYAVPAMLLCATLSAAVTMKAADATASPSPAASARTAQKFSPDSLKAVRLTRLKNTVGLTADQEAKAKPIIDQYVDDQIAAKGNKSKQMDLRAKYNSDIYAILNPDQQKKFASIQKEALAKMKAARAAKAAKESASPSPAPAKTN